MSQLSPAILLQCCWGPAQRNPPRSRAGKGWTHCPAECLAATRWWWPWLHSTYPPPHMLLHAETEPVNKVKWISDHLTQEQASTLPSNMKIEWSIVIYLVATLIEHVRFNRHGVWGALVQLLAIPLDRAGPQDILLLGSPDWYCVLLTLAIPMPHLGDCLRVLLGCNLGFIIQAFWVVCRPCLKSRGDVPWRALVS